MIGKADTKQVKQKGKIIQCKSTNFNPKKFN